MSGRLGHEYLIYESLYSCFENQPVWGSVCLLARQSQESTKGRTRFPKLVNLTGWESAESLCPRRWLAAVLWLLKHKGLHRCPVASGATNTRKRGHFKNKETMSTDPCLHVLHASLRKLIFIILWVQPLFQKLNKTHRGFQKLCDDLWYRYSNEEWRQWKMGSCMPRPWGKSETCTPTKRKSVSWEQHISRTVQSVGAQVQKKANGFLNSWSVQFNWSIMSCPLIYILKSPMSPSVMRPPSHQEHLGCSGDLKNVAMETK